MSRIFEALQQSGAAQIVEDPRKTENATDVIRTVSTDSQSVDSCATFTLAATPESKLVSISDEHGLAAEKTRVLATRLRHISARRPLKKLLITSSMKGEGKSVIAANLAITLAKSAKARILLFDGDLRQPSLAKKLGFGPAAELVTWWKQDVPMQNILYKAQDLPLWFLPAGQFAMQPLEVLQSQRLAELVNTLSDMFDWIVIDSPPMVPLADSSVWASMCDGVIIVVREKFTQVELLNQTVELIESKKMLGVVMNDISMSESKYYSNYYQYAGTKQESSVSGPALKIEPDGGR